jgi:hypothetical protein
VANTIASGSTTSRVCASHHYQDISHSLPESRDFPYLPDPVSSGYARKEVCGCDISIDPIWASYHERQSMPLL